MNDLGCWGQDRALFICLRRLEDESMRDHNSQTHIHTRHSNPRRDFSSSLQCFFFPHSVDLSRESSPCSLVFQQLVLAITIICNHISPRTGFGSLSNIFATFRKVSSKAQVNIKPGQGGPSTGGEKNLPMSMWGLIFTIPLQPT